MRSLYRHRLVLTLTGPILLALGLPLVVPFAATVLGETMHLQMRLSLPESLLATVGILVAWLVISRMIDVVLGGSDIGGEAIGRLVSAGASVMVLGGGYLLITGSIPLAVITAVVISGLFFALNTMLDVRAKNPRRLGRPG
ncbi:MAG: hypothetical protein ACTIC1_00175 [Brevibacterium sp.]